MVSTCFSICAHTWTLLFLHLLGSLTQAIRNFAKSLEGWLKNAMSGVTDSMIKTKVSTASFSRSCVKCLYPQCAEDTGSGWLTNKNCAYVRVCRNSFNYCMLTWKRMFLVAKIYTNTRCKCSLLFLFPGYVWNINNSFYKIKSALLPCVFIAVTIKHWNAL